MFWKTQIFLWRLHKEAQGDALRYQLKASDDDIYKKVKYKIDSQLEIHRPSTLCFIDLKKKILEPL